MLCFPQLVCACPAALSLVTLCRSLLFSSYSCVFIISCAIDNDSFINQGRIAIGEILTDFRGASESIAYSARFIAERRGGNHADTTQCVDVHPVSGSHGLSPYRPEGIVNPPTKSLLEHEKRYGVQIHGALCGSPVLDIVGSSTELHTFEGLNAVSCLQCFIHINGLDFSRLVVSIPVAIPALCPGM